MAQLFAPLSNLAVILEAAQTTLPAPTAAGDGAAVTGWRQGEYRPRVGDLAFTAAGVVTITNAELYEYSDGAWYSLGPIGTGTIALTATKGYRVALGAVRGDRLAVGGTLSAAVAVTVTATPHELQE